MAGADPRFEDGNYLVKITNNMLSQLHVPERVNHWSDINGHIFVTLFEGISGEPLRDVIRNIKTKEDEIHNVQVVIDTLSLDILHVSLSHITGEDVVAGRSKRAIGNLIEVILSLLQFILEGIGSDISSISDSTETEGFIDDPDMLTGELIDEILEKELSKKCQISHDDSVSSSKYKHGSENNNSTNELIALGKSRDDSRSVSFSVNREGTGNSTADLIALGKNMTGEHSYNTTSNTTDLIALGVSSHKLFTPPTREASQLHNNSHTLSSKGGASVNSTQSLIQEGAMLDRQLNGSRDRSLDDKGTENKSLEERSILDRSQGDTGPENKYSFLGQKYRDPVSGAQVAAVSPTKNVSPGLDQSNTTADSMVHHPSLDHPRSASEFDFIGARQRSTTEGRPGMALVGGSSSGVLGGLSSSNSASITHHLYHHFDRPVDRAGVSLPDSIFSSSLPLDGVRNGDLRADGSSSARDPVTRVDGVSTVPVQTSISNERQYRSRGATSQGLSGGVGKSHSYDNLQNLMHDTVALSRAAVRTSPLRHQAAPKTNVSSEETSSSKSTGKLSTPLRSALQRLQKETSSLASLAIGQAGSSYPAKSDQSTAQKQTKKLSPSKGRSSIQTSPQKGISSPTKSNDRGNKKVSFHVTRSSEDSLASNKKTGTTHQRPEPKGSPLRSSLKKIYDKPSASRRPARPRQTNTSPSHTTYPTAAAAADATSPRSRRHVTMPPGERRPHTFAEYMDKYYGTVDRRDRLVSSDGEERMSPISDSALDYSDVSPERVDGYVADGDVSEDVEVEIERIRRAARLPKSVTFDNIIDDSAPGQMGGIRRKLGLEDKKAQMKAQALAKLYEMELGDLAEGVDEHLHKARSQAKEKEKEYKKKVLRQPKINKYKAGKKYQTSVLRPRVRTRSTSAQPRGRKVTNTGRARKRSASASPAVGRRKPRSSVRVTDDDLLPWLLEEFPFLHLSTETLHELWRKSSRQIQQLTNAEQEVRRKKSKAQVQIEEAERRHSILMDIMKKELSHNERLKELKERRVQQQSVQTQLRNRRQQSARARRYYDEYQVRARAKMLKKSTREELVFKRLFREGLDIQKERIRDLRRYAKEERERRSEKQRNELDAIENYYRDQFAMLTEAMSRERQDLETKEKAQGKVVDQMKNELRQKMEREIRRFQDQLYRDEDDEYFRQLDADRLRQQLQLSRYQASV